MKKFLLLLAIAAVGHLGLTTGPAQAANVKITPLGSHDGEFCRSDRAFLFEDPNGTTLLYVTTKSAMIGMSRSMARELGPYGITVNTFWPGVMQTEVERPSVPKHMFEVLTGNQALPRQGTIHDLAKAMLFLCSDEAGYITGQNMLADGGANMI